MTTNKQVGQPKEEFILWECPDCEYRIPLDSLILRRDDFGCPGCDRPIGNFKILQGESHDPTNINRREEIGWHNT